MTKPSINQNSKKQVQAVETPQEVELPKDVLHEQGSHTFAPNLNQSHSQQGEDEVIGEDKEEEKEVPVTEKEGSTKLTRSKAIHKQMREFEKVIVINAKT